MTDPDTRAVSAGAEDGVTGTNRGNVARVVQASSLSGLAGVLAQVALVPYVLHQVGLSGFSTYSVLSAWIAFAALVDLGVRTEVTRRIASARGRRDWAGIETAVAESTSILMTAAGLLLLVGTATSSLLVDVALPDGSSSVEHPALLLWALIALVAVGVALDGWFAAFDGLQRGDLRQLGLLIGLSVRVLATVVLLQLNHSAWMLFHATLLSMVVTWAFYVIRLRRLAPWLRLTARRVRWHVARGFLSVSLLLVVSQVSDVVDFNVDRLVLSHFVGPEESAQYAIGIQLPIALRTLTLLPLAVLLTAVAEMRHGRAQELRVLFDQVTRLTLGLAAVATAGVVAVAPSLYDLYLGKGFGLAATAAQWLCVATLVNTLAAGWSLYASGSAWYRIIAVAAGLNVVVNASLSFVLTQAIGYAGALVGSVAGNVIGAAACYVGVRRREPRRWFRPLLPVALFGAALLGGALLLALLSPPSGLFGLVATSVLVLVVGACGLYALGVLSPPGLTGLRRGASGSQQRDMADA